MANFEVVNLNNTGAGSLRQAIADAAGNGITTADTISFQAGLTGTIQLVGSLTVQSAVTINGSGADKITVRGDDASPVFVMSVTGGQSNLAIGVNNLTVTKGLGNVGSGGGGFSINTQSVTLDHMVITDNRAPAGTSGGFLALGNAGTFFTLSNSTVYNNTAIWAAGGVVWGIGANGTFQSLIQNSTFTGNTAVIAGGGFEILSTGGVVIRETTIAGNTQTALVGAGGQGGGGFWNAGRVATIINSIIADNVSAVAGTVEILTNGGGQTSATYTLIENLGTQTLTGPTTGNITGTDPALGALANNGGVIPTMLPGAGSAAINAGDPTYTTATTPTTDERGFVRVVGGTIDLGAIEFGSALPVIYAPPTPSVEPPAPPPSKAPVVNADFSNLMRFQTYGTNPPLPATVTTPSGQVLPNPLLEQQKLMAGITAKVDAGTLSLQGALDQIVHLADGTTSVATLSYQFFTGKIPTKAGLDYLVSSPENPRDLNDGFYAGMSLENRYINFAVNLGTQGEGRAGFVSGYGALTLTDATAKAYAEIFGAIPTAAKLADILTPARVSYLTSLGGDALGAKAAMVGFLLGEAAKSDLGPYAASNENFLYDLADGTAAFGVNLHIYDNAGPRYIGLIGEV